jgi:aspartate kinase
LLNKVKINPNIIQTGAISIELCVDNHPEKISAFAQEASLQFDVQIEKDLTLLTIRHYNEQVIASLTENKEVILQQQNRNTIQSIYRIM